MNKNALILLDELIERNPELVDTKEAVAQVVELICRTYRAGGKALVCGNGGSAADSEHIVAELMKGFLSKREMPKSHADLFSKSGLADWGFLSKKLQRGVPAISLSGHTALVTAIMNDIDPYMIYAQQVYVYGKPEDMLIGLSTSGNAKNVCNALKVARVMGIPTVGFTGSGNPEFEKLCDIVVKAPEQETYRVQEYHLPIYHTICLMVEQELFE
ncbi:MAG: SIS domain-containing protein [Armatimonadetes bacterium]|nr:SIS domain-containing protein [Armatimonadota bacterium]